MYSDFAFSELVDLCLFTRSFNSFALNKINDTLELTYVFPFTLYLACVLYTPLLLLSCYV